MSWIKTGILGFALGFAGTMVALTLVMMGVDFFQWVF